VDERISQKSQEGKTGPYRGIANDEDGLGTKGASMRLVESQQPTHPLLYREGNEHIRCVHETGPVKGQCCTDLWKGRIVGELRLLYREGNDHVRDVRHTDPVKRADRNGIYHNHKVICDRIHDLQVTRGRSVIGSPPGINWRSANCKREATPFYLSPLGRAAEARAPPAENENIINRKAVTRSVITGQVNRFIGVYSFVYCIVKIDKRTKGALSHHA